MKKILLATTMLVGTAGFAAAEVTLSGSAVFGLGYDESIAVGNDTYSVMETYLTATAAEWADPAAGRAVAESILAAAPQETINLIGFGGTHYAVRQTAIALAPT